MIAQLLKVLGFIWNHPLNARGRMRAVWRLVRWQVGSRLLPGPVALPFVDETRLLVSRGMAGATGNWYCGLHEAAEMAFTLHFLRQTDLFLDVGANVGSYTILAGGACRARVLAVEPIRATFLRLSMNVSLNGLADAIVCRQLGLSDKLGSLRFTDDLDTVNHVLQDQLGAAGVEVEVTTIDELVGADVPALIKIDVEGHELSVLRGAGRVLAHGGCLAVILETNGSGGRYGVHDDELFAVMQGHGYAPYVYDPIERRLSEGSPRAGNAIFVKDRSRVELRVRQSPRHSLINGDI